MDKLLERADKIVDDSHDRHFQVVYGYFLGKGASFDQLWLSTGYFFYGRGKHSTIKPWSNEEQRQQLLRETGRESS